MTCKSKIILLVLVSPLLLAATKEGDDLIGTKPPEWQVTDWINSGPLKLEDLKGKVVLVRWWTAGGCPFCEVTAPALNEFHEKYAERGLVVVGMYHHKSDEPLKMTTVREAVDKLGFKFPIAVDPDWQTLNRWWLNDKKRKWTSVSFLLDRKGIIRHIHPGGQYAVGDEDYKQMKAKIEETLNEK